MVFSAKLDRQQKWPPRPWLSTYRPQQKSRHSSGRMCQFIPFYTWWRHQMETFSALLPFVRGIHRSPVNSPHKGQWRRALMFTLICVWINGWVNNREAGDFRCQRAHYDVIVMYNFCTVLFYIHFYIPLWDWLNQISAVFWHVSEINCCICVTWFRTWFSITL